MADKRETARAEVRRRRLQAKAILQSKQSQTYRRVQSAMNSARSILDHEGFSQVARALSIHAVPKLHKKRRQISAEERAESIKECLDEASLEFVVAWKFFFPLLDQPSVAAYLEEHCPGFITELKDAFIALVVEGPFPHAMSGHRGRKHAAHYHNRNGRRPDRRRLVNSGTDTRPR